MTSHTFSVDDNSNVLSANSPKIAEGKSELIF